MASDPLSTAVHPAASRILRAAATLWLTVGLAAALAPAAAGQASQHALRFHGTGAAQQDRARIAVDDDAPGPDASEPCDVGAGDFTIELWLHGNLADNPTASFGGDVLTSDASWRAGNALADRDSGGTSGREFGISVAGGLVRFGVGPGDGGTNVDHTLEGSATVLDGAWHHVACVRHAASGAISIYVDGALDFQSPPGISSEDLSFPDGGGTSALSPWGPFLVLAAEKHDSGPTWPAFDGTLDELRVWNVARTQTQIQAARKSVVAAGTAGLVGYWRFEEGAGTVLGDTSSAQSPAGQLIAGVPGNGEWTSWGLDPSSTAPIENGSLPPGFQRQLLASALVEPTSVAAAPDGRILVGERGGRILVLENDVLLPQPMLALPVTSGAGERGLVGLALDPQFAQNGWLYAFYVTPQNLARVARFTAGGNSAAPASETVLWENPDPADPQHVGGGIAFGAGERLFIAVGDHTQSSNAQDLGNFMGKLLRLEKDGSIPADNPFAQVPGARAEIYALGLRNPFRLGADEASGAVWIGDVGGNADGSHEEIALAASGVNFGWPDQEGPSCFVSSCASYQSARWWYRHDDAQYWWSKPQGAVIAGPVYRGASFPPEYQGSLLVGDYANRWIRRLALDASGAVVSEAVLLAAPEAGTVVDLDVGPDGALYYATFGNPSGHGKGDPSALYRIVYSGGGNLAPEVFADAAPKSGPVGTSVQLSSSGTYDPDGGPQALSFLWELGDGATSTEADPAHVYATPGLFQAKLTVSDGAASSQALPIALAIGNPPVATIELPPAGTTYRAGEALVFSGQATDLEDGPLPSSALSWKAVLIHRDHAHPFLGPIAGAGGVLPIPASGHPPEDTSYELQLTATDSDGLSATAVRDLSPLVSTLVLDTVPQGIPVFLDGQAEPTPRTYESLALFQHDLEAQPWFTQGGELWLFHRWSDGGARAHVLTAPEGGLAVTARYALAKQASAAIPVAAASHNAQHHPSTGQAFASLGDPFSLVMGKGPSGETEAGLEFALPLRRGWTVLDARLELTAAADDLAPFSCSIRAYDSADAPPFVSGASAAITVWAPLGAASVGWSVPAFATGQVATSPDLALLVQAVVDRPDWQSGGRLGLALDPAAGAAVAERRFRNVASGTPAVLRITYAWPARIPAIPAKK